MHKSDNHGRAFPGKTEGNLGTVAFDQRHYAVPEVARLLNLHPDVIRRLFEHETGVLVLGDTATTRHKRRYKTLRIPTSVVERVYRRLLNA